MNIPQHIAIIMDGNGRWAKERLLPRNMGHKKGSEVAELITKYCRDIGVKSLTLYTFSMENWNRSQEEVNALMALLREYLHSRVDQLIKDGFRVSFIGERDMLPDDIVSAMKEAEELSIANSFHLVLAISYSGRKEIVAAMNEMCRERAALGDEGAITAEYFGKFLSSYKLGVPDPDLLIRTGGEYRLSNFLLWQSAYSELYFTDKYWPEFGKDDLLAAIAEFNKRERRYGK